MDKITASSRQAVLQIRTNVLSNFSNPGVIEKSMTEDDFRESYKKETHELYTRKALVEFEKAIRAEIGEREVMVQQAISEAIEGLSKVNVRTVEGKTIPMWVRERKNQ